MTDMGFYFDQTRCTGCYTCAVACKDWHDLQAPGLNYMRVNVIEYGRFPDLFAAYLAQPCYHCANPACVKVCPTDAIFKREFDGIVVVDRDKCLGQEECSRLCLRACSWNAPQFGPEPDARMEKCDLCLERLEQGLRPICVEACPMYALDAGPLDELRKKYGDAVEATGFKTNAKIGPSAVFKPKEPGREILKTKVTGGG